MTRVTDHIEKVLQAQLVYDEQYAWWHSTVPPDQLAASIADALDLEEVPVSESNDV